MVYLVHFISLIQEAEKTLYFFCTKRRERKRWRPCVLHTFDFFCTRRRERKGRQPCVFYGFFIIQRKRNVGNHVYRMHFISIVKRKRNVVGHVYLLHFISIIQRKRKCWGASCDHVTGLFAAVNRRWHSISTSTFLFIKVKRTEPCCRWGLGQAPLNFKPKLLEKIVTEGSGGE